MLVPTANISGSIRIPNNTLGKRIDMQTHSVAEIDEAAREQLKLILGFFPRVDSMLATVLGADLGMLAVVVAQLPATHPASHLAWIAVLPTIPCAASLLNLYQSAFPRLDGGAASLVYFREIADRSETAYVSSFLNQKDGDHARDLLEQAWRNARILSRKYRSLRRAFLWLAGAIVPWILTLVVFRLFGEPPIF